jgi:hypothetical protein
MAAPILSYVYLFTVLYLPSVAVATFNTVTIVSLYTRIIDVYTVALYSPVAQLFSTANQWTYVGSVVWTCVMFAQQTFGIEH